MTALPFSLFDSYQKKIITLNPKSTVIPNILKMYSCGPTVYNYQHIGNLRAAWLADTVASTARLLGWKVEWVMNITDVGHLVGDGDEARNVTDTADKIEQAAQKTRQSVAEIVNHYTEDYQVQTKTLALEIPTGKHLSKATEYIESQMLLALNLLANGRAYLLEDGIYFDSTANEDINPFPSPTGNSNYTGREIKNTTKNPADFALWKFVSETSLQKWKFNQFDATASVMIQLQQANPTPEYLGLPNKWGSPGWHSECVAMICKILNGSFPPRTENKRPVIDLHLGGEDHIDIHHKNEILQSRASGFELSRYWVHNKFVTVDGQKMSKSKGNVYRLVGDKNSLLEHGFDPLAYRLLLFEHHYTQTLDFTWDKLQQAQARLYKLRKESAQIRSYLEGLISLNEKNQSLYQQEFVLLQDNLNTPKFLERYGSLTTEILTDALNENFVSEHNYLKLRYFEERFLKLQLYPKIPKIISSLLRERLDAKRSKDYLKADSIRDQLLEYGWQIDDYRGGKFQGVWLKNSGLTGLKTEITN